MTDDGSDHENNWRRRMKFRRHLPNFVETADGPSIVEFETLEQLVAIPEVARWMQPTDGWPFYRLSLAHAPTGRAALMAEYAGGVRWWTVGYIEKPVDLDLPRWEPKSDDGWEGRWSNIDKPDFGKPPAPAPIVELQPRNLHAPYCSGGNPYRTFTSNNQKVDIYLDTPIPVEIMTGIMSALEPVLAEQKDVRHLSIRLACE